ncbi:MAG: methyltransferase, TIGR04325 family, partial [Ignavibacteriales bacterium]|nr:methyltransferase, TIGR04325 family [Ignavibacteriales bacterium]
MVAKVKETVKLFLPPVLSKLFARNSFSKSFTGNYSSWDEALAHSTGYDSPEILNTVTQALLKVKRGQAEYERDSVLFDSIEYSWPLLSGLMLAAAQNYGKLSVVDVGGSLGSSFFQNRKFLAYLKSVRWSVVEQKHFVEAGKAHFENSRLRFYSSLMECV